MLPIKPIELTDDEYRQLGGALTEYTRELESEHSAYFHNIRVWNKWRNAEPKTKVKDWPWPNASNIVVPIIQAACDATTARMFSTLQARRRQQWTVRSENEQFHNTYANDIARFLNRAAVNEFDTFWSVLDWIDEMVEIGSSVLATTWEERERYLLLPGSTRPRRVVLKRGPVLKHWPAHLILWEPDQNLNDADAIITQERVTRNELVRLLTTEGYREEAVQATLAMPDDDGSPGAEVEEERRARQGFSKVQRARYDKRVAWLDYPTLKAMGVKNIDKFRIATGPSKDDDRVSVPIIVEFSPTAQQVFRVLPHHYYTADGHPFREIFFRRRKGMVRGVGLAKILEQTQRGISTMLNQGIDAVTLANSIPYKTTNAKNLQKPLGPGRGFLVDDMNDLQPVGMPKTVMPEIALIQLVQTYAERVSGVNDPLLGRESRSGGHPSPATNYLGMLEQSREIGSLPVRVLREQYSKVGEYVASLYQQFDTDPDGRIRRIYGDADGSRIEEWLFPTEDSIPGNAIFDVFVLSETENPQQAMRDAVLVQQATQQYFSAVMSAIPHLSNPQVDPTTKQTIVKFIETFGKAHQRFLEAADWDEAEEAILKLQEAGVENAGELQRFQQLFQQLAAQGGAPPAPQPGVGPVQGVPANGAGGLLPPMLGG